MTTALDSWVSDGIRRCGVTRPRESGEIRTHQLRAARDGDDHGCDLAVGVGPTLGGGLEEGVVDLLVLGLAYTYLPNGDYEPIRGGERGTLGEGVAALASVPEGRPALIAQERAAEAGRLEDPPPDEEDPATTSTTTTVPEEEAPTTTVTPRRTTPPVTEDVPSRNQRSRFPRSRFPRSPRRPQPDVGRRRNRER